MSVKIPDKSWARNMGYIEKSLAGDEALIAKARFQWLYHVFGYAALVLFLAVGAYLYAELQAPWFAAMVGAVGLIIFVRVMVPIWTTEIRVMSERVILKRDRQVLENGSRRGHDRRDQTAGRWRRGFHSQGYRNDVEEQRDRAFLRQQASALLFL